jgi:hypothetical protein
MTAYVIYATVIRHIVIHLIKKNKYKYMQEIILNEIKKVDKTMKLKVKNKDLKYSLGKDLFFLAINCINEKNLDYKSELKKIESKF